MSTEPTADSTSGVIDTVGDRTNLATSSNAAESDKPVQSERYNADDADMTLISSDNIAFKVHAYRLQSASSVFRSMMEIAPPVNGDRVIHLSDTTLECSRIVELVLDIVYKVDVDRRKFTLIYDELDVLAFAAKYDMPLINKLVTLNTLTYRRSDSYPDQSLRLAWILKDTQLLETALKDHLSIQRPVDAYIESDIGPRLDYMYDEYHDSLDGEREGVRRWSDPSQFTYLDFLHLPPSLVWIMLQATNVARPLANEEEYQVAYMMEAMEHIKRVFQDVDDDSSEGDGDEERKIKRVRR